MAAAAMRPGPPNTSHRRPPRRQKPSSSGLPTISEHVNNRSNVKAQYRTSISSNWQLRDVRFRCRSLSAIVFSLLLIISCSALAELTDTTLVPETAMTTISPSQALREQRIVTVGYLTAIKGELKDRQGLAISGAFSMALDEVRIFFILFLCFYFYYFIIFNSIIL